MTAYTQGIAASTRGNDDPDQGTSDSACKELVVVPLRDGAPTLTRGTSGSVGLDVRAFEATIVKAWSVAKVKTGISFVPPRGQYVQLMSRSGMAANNGVIVVGGVIDPDYTGEIFVILAKLSDADFQVAVGQRIAQAVLLPVANVTVRSLDDSAGHPVISSERGPRGFGSTDLVYQ